MSERGIAHVVAETGGSYYVTYIRKLAEYVAVSVFTAEAYGDLIGKRASHRRNLKTMCQAVMYEHAARQREHLRLVLQPPEG